MKSLILEKSKIYKVCNDIALKGEIVIFGSTYTANFPFYELSQKYYLNNAIYNRSIEGLTLDDAKNVLEECVLNMKPSKIFLSIGECDDFNDFSLNTYKLIVDKIKKELPYSEVYVMSVSGSEMFNDRLKEMCAEINTKYIGIDYGKSYEAVFKQLSCFFRKGRITYCEAFQIS